MGQSFRLTLITPNLIKVHLRNKSACPHSNQWKVIKYLVLLKEESIIIQSSMKAKSQSKIRMKKVIQIRQYSNLLSQNFYFLKCNYNKNKLNKKRK